MEEVINGILIREVETKNIMTKSSLPVGGYSVNPYVGCTHACKYCYASFMKRFTGHKEEWGTFLDVKHWSEIKNPKKYEAESVAYCVCSSFGLDTSDYSFPYIAGWAMSSWPRSLPKPPTTRKSTPRSGSNC